LGQFAGFGDSLGSRGVVSTTFTAEFGSVADRRGDMAELRRGKKQKKKKKNKNNGSSLAKSTPIELPNNKVPLGKVGT
jgi:hypothetical protein